MRKVELTYLQYGISVDNARRYATINLPLTTFRNTSNKNLKEKYGLEEEEIIQTKNKIERQPIDEEILIDLLEKNNYVCCLCKGQKSDAFIIHHIEEYSISQDNSYANLAVICPNDHDLVHREGQSLTNKITPKQLISAKLNWEETVKKQNLIKASLKGDVHEIDFCNIPRIYDLCNDIFGQIPEVTTTERLITENLILPSGYINDEYLNKQFPERIHTPLKFWALGGGSALRYYFHKLFLKISERIEIVNLEDLLKKRVLKSTNVEGKFCIYVGGVYGKRPNFPVTHDSEPTHLYVRRKPFFIEWLVAPQYLTSSTATRRLSNRTVYFIFGRIRSVGVKDWKGEKFIHFDIRPYIFGIPNHSINYSLKVQNTSYDIQNKIDKILENFMDDDDLPF